MIRDLSGQQPTKRKPVPWVAQILPAEAAWSITLPAEPAAGGARDFERVYVPIKAPRIDPEQDPVLEARTLNAPANLPADPGAVDPPAPPLTVPARPLDPPGEMVVAINRETGLTEWTVRLATAWAPVVTGGAVYVAVPNAIVALDAATGRRIGSIPLERAPHSEMLTRGNVLVLLTEPDELIGVSTESRTIVWRRTLTKSAPLRMIVDDEALYVATVTGRLMRIMLRDGAHGWDIPLDAAALSQPGIAEDRVFVGTSAHGRTFLALDAETGAVEWKYDYRYIGGDPVGAAALDDVVFMAAMDNILRAFDRGNGNQKWKKNIPRPVLPPMTLAGAVVVAGINPTLTALNAKDGSSIGTWSAPPNTELQGRPLIDPYLRPFKTAIVIILKDGQMTALRPTAMLFKEPLLTPLTALSPLPGRPLPIERLNDPAPAAPPAPPPGVSRLP